jgi:hypothetical protein
MLLSYLAYIGKPRLCKFLNVYYARILFPDFTLTYLTLLTRFK